MKVVAGKLYHYYPNLTDVVDARTSLKFGDVVRVVNMPDSAPANSLGHCHVADPNTGQFVGLVCTESLKPVR